jgi:hypothetical protein
MLVRARKTKRHKFSKNRSRSNSGRKRKYLKNIRGAGKKEDIQKILEFYKKDPKEKLLVFKVLRFLPEESLDDLIIGMDKNPNYLNEWIHIYPDGSIFYGKLQDGTRHGTGIYFLSDKDNNIILEGEFENNKLINGKMTNQTGLVLEGEFKNNTLHKGKVTYPDGDIHEGEFNNGELIKGKKIYQNGTYEGIFENNEFIAGKITLKNGDILNGPNGPNKIIFSNGDIYEGPYNLDYKIDENDKDKIFYIRNGIGKMTYANGSVYEGSYKNNKRDGYGKFTDPADGTVYQGEWKDGKRYGEGRQSNAKDEIYQGNFRKGKRHGQGNMSWPGNVKTGTWDNDNFVEKNNTNI